MSINWDEKPKWALGQAGIKGQDDRVWFDETHYQYLYSKTTYMFISDFTSDNLIDKKYPPSTMDTK